MSADNIARRTPLVKVGAAVQPLQASLYRTKSEGLHTEAVLAPCFASVGSAA